MTSINESLQNTDGDEAVLHMFTASDLQLSPEEYAARRAHNWGCFSFHLYQYRDRSLGAWMRRLGEILFDEEEIQRCRERFLTPEEIAEVRKREAEEF